MVLAQRVSKLRVESVTTSLQKPLIIVDGSGYIFRAFYALPPMTRPDGTPVNAVYGFCNMLARTLIDHQAAHVVVVFDAARKTFRNDIFPDYKAHRPPPPEELVPQFSLIHEACDAFHVPQMRIEGFEADDLIATLTYHAQQKRIPVRIITSDKDMLQLMAEDVEIFDPIKNKVLGLQDVQDKFGVPPEKVIEVQALCGDSSDNIPGVPGIGPKTAAELIHQFGSLDNLYQHLEQIKQPKRRESLEVNKEKAFISYELVKLRRDAPVDIPEDVFAYHQSSSTLIPFLHAQGFTSLLKRFEHDNSKIVIPSQNEPVAPQLRQVAPQIEPHYITITDLATLQSWIDNIIDEGIVAIDTETTSVHARSAQLVGISLCVYPGKAAYIPLGHATAPSQGSFLDSPETVKQLSLAQVIPLIHAIASDASVVKIGHNIKYDMLILAQHNIRFTNVHDTMLMSYLLNGSKHLHNMDDLAKLYLDHETIKFSDIMSAHKAKTFADIPVDVATQYAAEDADITRRFYGVFRPQIFENHLVHLYEAVERPLIQVLMDMENYGAYVDPLVLKNLSQDFAKQMSLLETKVFDQTQQEFNLASPKQMGDILFESMKLPGGKKGKTGAYATGVEVLEELVDQGYHVAQDILDWRQLAKLKSTYTDTLIEQIHPLTGRVHTSYGMAITSTGRLSSSDPNLQNIPIRTPIGREIRKAFAAPKGRTLISLDYSQIELRLLAHIAHIDPLIEAFRAGEDIHTMTAAEVFDLPKASVTREIRSKAKAINFGIIYGISPFGLAKQLKIRQAEAKNYIEAYFRKYPGIRTFMDEMIALARKQGYVETIMKRRCFTPEIHSKNPAVRGFSERQAINAPLQGSNADIIKRAMIRIHEEIQKRNFDAQMILQVHDELVIEAEESQAEQVALAARSIMQGVVQLKVPLLVDYSWGSNWGDIH